MQQQPRRWPGFDKCVETKLRWDVYIRPWPPGWSFWRRIYTSRGSERVKRQAQTARRQEEDLEKRKGRLPPGEEVSRIVYVLLFENGLFLFWSQQKFKAERRFQWGHLWVSDRSGSEEAERSQRSEATKPEVTKLSEARMPKQRQAGQLEAAQARKETCFLFQAHGHGHNRLLFWRKLQWKKFWTEGNRHHQSKPAGHRHGPGLKERHRLRGHAKKNVSAWQGLFFKVKISRNRTAGCLQERQ